MIITFKATRQIEVYFVFSLGITGLLIFVDLFLRPYHSKAITVTKILQKLATISIGAYIFYARAFELDKKPYFILLVVCLITALSFLLKLAIRKGLHEILPVNEKFDMGNLNVSDMIYRYEKIKMRICEGNDNCFKETTVLNAVNAIYAIYAKHKEVCQSIDCYCKEYGLDLFQYKLEKLFGPTYPGWFSKVLYIMNYMLQGKYEHFSFKANLKSSMNLYLLRIWSTFSIQNFGNTSKILGSIRKVQFQGKEKGAKYVHNSKESTILTKWNSIELKIIIRLVSEQIENFNATGSLGQWETAYGLAGNKELNCNKVNSNIAILSINRLEELGDRMESAITKKVDFLKKLADNSDALVEYSTKFLRAAEKVDHVLLLLSHCNLDNCFRLNFLEIFFNLFIREDFYKAWIKVKAINSKHLTANMISTIKFEGTDRPNCQMVFVGVSGEQATWHTISHVTVNIELLGYSVTNIINKD